jgi:hypothetical protein
MHDKESIWQRIYGFIQKLCYLHYARKELLGEKPSVLGGSQRTDEPSILT